MARAPVPTAKPRRRSTAPADSPHNKELGAFYTPREVAGFLADWASRSNSSAHVLDPSCGDGRFLLGLENGVGVDIDAAAVAATRQKLSPARILHDDFFRWALATDERFSAAVGNPPFIRYQRFAGEVRVRAQELCRRSGADVTGLSSSWAPFVVGASSLLTAGGRVAFVVPAEIGYAVYARPVLEWLLNSFGRVDVVAVRRKLFPELSEDVWILRADGYGGVSPGLHFAQLEEFVASETAWDFEFVERQRLDELGYRLRSLLLPPAHRRLYHALASSHNVVRLGEVAKLGIGYVTGANDFFHFRPSEAKALRIPSKYLRVTVRSNRDLAGLMDVDRETLDSWIAEDRQVYLLALTAQGTLPKRVTAYLESTQAREAQSSYKCRNRDPWYVVPDVTIPDAFLSIMSNGMPRLVGNSGAAVCTNSVHAVRFNPDVLATDYIYGWNCALTRLSCEVEGHALGGGLLKLEPGEARRVVLAPDLRLPPDDERLLTEALRHMKLWRHGQDKEGGAPGSN